MPPLTGLGDFIEQPFYNDSAPTALLRNAANLIMIPAYQIVICGSLVPDPL